MNAYVEKDIQEFVANFALGDMLGGKTFLVTGATGLIGTSLIRCILAMKKNIHIVAPVRNVEKAKSLFDEDSLTYIQLINCDLSHFDFSSVGSVDYIIHCAAPTSSKFFVEQPVETFNFIYDITANLLEYAKNNKVKGFVYLSSLEVYGEILDDRDFIREDFQGYLDPLSVRSSYPMAKRATENLCCLYAAEYGVPVKIARLTQTTGAGIDRNDNRVIAQFCRLTAIGQDIVLHTTGESARPYCYLTDAISAILFVLLKGTAGEAYNVANEETYISARGMAEFLRDNFNPQISVRVELNDNMGYAPVTKQKLSTDKLKSLGWKPLISFHELAARLINYLK